MTPGGRRPARPTRRALIETLIALHPAGWRREYGDEYRALLEDTPMSVRVVVDVVRAAGRMHLAARPFRIALVAALTLSTAGEIVAVQGHLADNILWAPTSVGRAAVLAAVLLPWIPVVLAGRATRATRPSRRAAPERSRSGPDGPDQAGAGPW